MNFPAPPEDELEDAAQPELVELTAKIVSAYVSNNSVGAGDLPHLISETHAALSRASGGAVPRRTRRAEAESAGQEIGDARTT